MNEDIQIIDEGDLRKYRTEIPNMIDEIGLSVYAIRLYLHIKRITGAKGGKCWESVRTMAEKCNMSKSSVSDAKDELLQAGLITVEEGDHTKQQSDTLRIVDIWAENFRKFAIDSCPPNGQAVRLMDTSCPPNGQAVRQAGHKKELYKKEQKKKEPEKKIEAPEASHRNRYQNAEHSSSVEFMEKMGQLGVTKPQANELVWHIAEIIGKKALALAEDDDRTLNEIRPKLVILAKWGYTTTAKLDQLAEAAKRIPNIKFRFEQDKSLLVSLKNLEDAGSLIQQNKLSLPAEKTNPATDTRPRKTVTIGDNTYVNAIVVDEINEWYTPVDEPWLIVDSNGRQRGFDEQMFMARWQNGNPG